MNLEQTHGNAEVIAALERHLAHARQGRVSYLVITAIHDEKATCWFGGSVTRVKAAKEATDKVAGMMRENLTNRTLPPRDPTLGADHVCYNMAVAPMSFDFLMWLVDAEMTRVREGAPAPLKVAFWFGRDGKVGLGTPGRIQMLEYVARPMLALIGAVEHERALGGRFKEFFAMRGIVAAARAGEYPPTLRAPSKALADMDAWLAGRTPVTITLREAADWPHRNSDLAMWLSVAYWLKSRGESVVFVRDTAKAAQSVSSAFDTCPAASVDLHARMALYERAKANLFVSNGPGTLAFFGQRPWLMFLKLEDDTHGYKPDTPAWWRENMGMEQGGQLPWAGPQQRFVWAKPDYNTVTGAYERLIGFEEKVA